MFSYLGPQMAAAPYQVPYISSILSRAHGVVLELGPGAGDQSHHFRPDKITKIYGAEPNVHFHAALREKAEQVGLGDKYIPIEAGAQPSSLLPALQRVGLSPKGSVTLPEGGVFDSIVAVKSMCSAPQREMAETLAVVRALLKPGGEFLWFEHLQNDRNLFMQAYTWVLNFALWPGLMGGCRMDGQLDKVLMGMSGWEKIDIQNIGEYKGHEVFRYAKGVCVKA
jgi:phospholipid N-methyltransferase